MRTSSGLPCIAAVVAFIAGSAGAAPLVKFEEAPRQLPLFDAHIHLQPGDDGDEFVEMALDNGLVGMAFQGVIDTKPLGRDYPGFCIPRAWATDFDEDTAAEIAAQIDRGARCIGELSVKHFDPHGGPPTEDYDTHDPILMAVYAVAGSLGVPINLHVDYSDDDIWQFGVALRRNRDTDFVWAHAGDATAEEVDSLVSRHPNLYVDISCRNDLFDRNVREDYTIEDQSILDEEGVLKPEWHGLFERHPDRFLFGTDVGPPGRFEIIGDITDYYRRAFGQLSAPARTAVARGNGERLYLEDAVSPMFAEPSNATTRKGIPSMSSTMRGSNCPQ